VSKDAERDARVAAVVAAARARGRVETKHPPPSLPPPRTPFTTAHTHLLKLLRLRLLQRLLRPTADRNATLWWRDAARLLLLLVVLLPQQLLLLLLLLREELLLMKLLSLEFDLPLLVRVLRVLLAKSLLPKARGLVHRDVLLLLLLLLKPQPLLVIVARSQTLFFFSLAVRDSLLGLYSFELRLAVRLGARLLRLGDGEAGAAVGVEGAALLLLLRGAWGGVRGVTRVCARVAVGGAARAAACAAVGVETVSVCLVAGRCAVAAVRAGAAPALSVASLGAARLAAARVVAAAAACAAAA